MTDPLGPTVRYGYGEFGFLTSVTDPAGGVTRYTYTGGGLATITDPRGITFLTNEYDAHGRVARQTQADGGVWRFGYETRTELVAFAGTFCRPRELVQVGNAYFPCPGDPRGRVMAASVLDPRGHLTRARFNETGYLVSQTDALGQTTTFERAPGTNLLLSTTDPLGRVTRSTYDATGNVTSITDPQGNVRSFTYEPTFNKLTSVTDPLGNVTRFAYDTNGNLTGLTDPLGATTAIAYNAFGQPVSTTDPLGNTTTFTYNSQGDLVTITDPLGNVTTREYDPVSRLERQVDPRGQSTAFSYDPLNRLTSIVDPLGGATAFGYDPNGNLLTVTDARGNTTSHAYDTMDRLSTRTDPLGRVEAYTYDPNGNLTQFTDRKGQVSAFQYDPLNRRTRATYADGSVATFTYDAAGRLTQADDTADPHRPIALTYDTLDRLTAETTALGTVSYQYDPLGRRTEMTVSGQAPVSYTYDAASRLRTITQAPLNPVDIQYDPLNRRTRLTLPNGVSTEYQYDAASRLTALIYRNALGPLGDLTYQYDPAGNRTAVGGSFARTLHPDPVPSATYDAANQQLAFGGKTMTYDPNGSLATLTEGGATTTFTWDARNRLAALAGATTGSFAYDGTGRRARKTIAGVPTTFQHDGAEIVQAVVDGVPTPFLSGPQIDEPWARGDTEYYLADALGSIVALTEATGRPTTSYVYSAFGQTTSSGPASPNPFQYTGRENDGTSLYYYRARYYNPILLRFISEDALDLGEMILFKQADPSDATVRLLYSAVRSDPQLLHPTLYAVNSPVNYTDPSGEIVPQLVGCVVGAGISVALDVGAGRKINWFDAGVGCALGLVGGWLPGKSLHFGLHGPHHYFPRLGRSLPHLQFDWGIKGVRAKPKGFRIPLPERLGPARDRDIRFSIPGL